jgi:hypothetical protein
VTVAPLKAIATARHASVLVVLTAGVLFLILRAHIRPYDSRTGMAKAIVASLAIACVVYESHRLRRNRPVSEASKRVVALVVAAAAVLCYFTGFKYTYPPYWHHSDLYHYYMGAKYFPELGYHGLYRCTAVAQDQLGTVTWKHEATGQRFRLDMSSEVRGPEKRIRNLGGDNLLVPLGDVLEHPDRCTSRFSPERWKAFKDDVAFFRIVADKAYWEGMQQDHGYNPPPVWTILGSFFSNLRPASARYMQVLAGLDMIYLAGAFAMTWWAFGWRVFAVAVIFWGCQAAAPAPWTAGAFLRQDWFFYLIASACLARKRCFKLAGASIVYAGLLRIFPILIVVGWLTVAGAYVIRRGRLARSHRDVMVGGLLAAAVIVPLSLYVAGSGSYYEFYRHTLNFYDRTPLTNHMGLPVLISHEFRGAAGSSRMEYTVDQKLADPFETWKRMRSERYDRYRWLGFVITVMSGAFFIRVVYRIRPLWIAGSLAQMFIVLGAQLTSYYYSFLVLSALLTRARRSLEVPLFAFVILSQLIFWLLPWNDDRYGALTLLSLLLCYGLLLGFLRRPGLRIATANLRSSSSTFPGTESSPADR